MKLHLDLSSLESKPATPDEQDSGTFQHFVLTRLTRDILALYPCRSRS